MAKRVTLVLVLKAGDESYRDEAGVPRLRAANGADFPLLLAAQLGRCTLTSMTEEPADQEPEPVSLFG